MMVSGGTGSCKFHTLKTQYFEGLLREICQYLILGLSFESKITFLDTFSSLVTTAYYSKTKQAIQNPLRINLCIQYE